MSALNLLLVEDNPADVELTRDRFQDSRLRPTLHVAMDGVQALDFLYRRGEHDAAPRPDLILLDLNLPRKDGLTVLRAIKNDAGLRRIPVVVLTSSQADRDVLESYDLGANSYITKPIDLGGFEEVVRSIEDFWFSVVRLPQA